MKKSHLLFLSISVLFQLTSKVFSQTAGSGTVSSIESKAKQISSIDDQVADLNHQHLASYTEEQDKFYNLKIELDGLYKEKEFAMDDMRRGEFCKGCDRTATQLRKTGIQNVMQHFYDNGGTYSATPAQLEAKEAEYDKIIADKKEEIRRFVEEQNEFSKKREQLSQKIESLKNDNERLRQEITELSYAFKDKILAEAKSMHSNWGKSLMAIVADKHYMEDQINILQVKIADLGKEEAKALAEFEEKLRRKNAEEIKQLEFKISSAQDRGINLENNHQNRLSPLNQELAELTKRRQEIDLAIKYETLTEEQSQNYQKEMQVIDNRILTVQNLISGYENDYEEKAAAIKLEISELNDKIWSLKTTAFSQLLKDGLDNLKKAFLMRRNILNDAIVAKTNSLQDVGRLLQNKKEEFRQKNIEYTSRVDGERIRMMRACSQAGATCAGTDTVGEVNLNWSKVSGCVSEMEGSHNSGDPIYGCEEESATYLQHYQNKKSGMSDSDLEALSRTNTRTRYDLILNKVTN